VIALFDKMIFEMNEALHSGIIEHGKYIPGFTYIRRAFYYCTKGVWCCSGEFRRDSYSSNRWSL